MKKKAHLEVVDLGSAMAKVRHLAPNPLKQISSELQACDRPRVLKFTFKRIILTPFVQIFCGERVIDAQSDLGGTFAYAIPTEGCNKG